MNDDGDLVGYGRPPKEGQFKPGQSGNPAGRPKGVRNFKTDLQEELSEATVIREGEREITISKQRALIKQMVSSALAGNTRAVMSLMTMCMREFGNVNDQEPDLEDARIIKALGKPAKRSKTPASSSASDKITSNGGSHAG